MSRNKKIAVFGLFSSREHLTSAINELTAEGFAPSEISALLPNVEATRDLAHEKHSKAAEGAAVGGVSGGVAGGTLGLLLGIGAIAIPGLGPLIAAGPILAALAGVGVGGTVGTFTGALIGMGIPEYEAKRYETHVKNGGYLMSVHADDSGEAERAKAILNLCGATDVDEKKEAHPKAS
ncbi:MAG TPA: quinol:electron acceptor oxidoreductase subunit ActD [Kofleriaceae bacterium]|nr:quinol:electron acceptor oxidoreductase subunit ActD [Kofleriaceae bacterium]